MKEFDRFSFPRNYSGKVPLFFRKFPEKFRRKFPEISELTTLMVSISWRGSGDNWWLGVGSGRHPHQSCSLSQIQGEASTHEPPQVLYGSSDNSSLEQSPRRGGGGRLTWYLQEPADRAAPITHRAHRRYEHCSLPGFD